MKKLVMALALLFVSSPLLCQTPASLQPEITTFQLLSPWDFSGEKPRWAPERARKSCLDLTALTQRCGVSEVLSYGNRFGINWDIFAVNGEQTRIVEIGDYDLNDKYDVPYIRPWSKLRPGEQRAITVNTSGGDGAPGRNGDGTVNKIKVREGFADKPVARQVSSGVKNSDGSERDDNYTPFMQIAEGRRYAVRVVHGDDDHYLVIHVDKLVRGEQVTITVMRTVSPPKPEY